MSYSIFHIFLLFFLFFTLSTSHKHIHEDDHHNHEEPHHHHEEDHKNEHHEEHDNHHAHQHIENHVDDNHYHYTEKKNPQKIVDPLSKPSSSIYITETLLATAMISIFPVGIIFLVPLGTTSSNGKNVINQKLLKTLLAFAVGGLLGDVFLHLLPHSLDSHVDCHEDLGEHNHAEEHDHSSLNGVGLQILGGMLVFFLIEKLAVLNSDAGHGHSHSIGNKPKTNKKGGHKEVDSDTIARERLQVSAILNIISDTIHNFTDGLAIAAAFMISFRDGCSTTLAVLLHEIPHEIGDLAILVQAGKTKREVIFIQFLTAIGAMLGAIVGLFLGTISAGSWIIPFTAGGFIYIATADVIPQLFDKTDITQTISEILAMSIAAFAMLLISYVE